MRFSNSKRVEKSAWEVWRDFYFSDPAFRVVRCDMTMLPLPKGKRR